MIPYARLRPGAGFRPGRAGLYYAQRLATAPSVRRTVSWAIASAIRLRHGTESWQATDPHHAKVVVALRQQGIATLAGLVSHEVATGMLNYFEGKEVVGPDGRLMSLPDLPSGTATAAYPLRTVLENSDVMNVVNAAPVLRAAAHYLGCKPTLSSLGVRWSFPGSKVRAVTQHFHRDLDDWRSLKLFVYLTDVDGGSGPHSYVSESHRTPGRLRARAYAQAEINSRYGSDKVRLVLGPRGTSFMADTYGIHAGIVPTDTPRLILQAQYSLLPVFAFLYEPMTLRAVPPGLDPYINRLLIAGR